LKEWAGPFNHGEIGSAHWLWYITESKRQQTADKLAGYGYATSGIAVRVLSVDSGSSYRNGTRLETVRVDLGGRSITWTLDTFGTTSSPLSKTVPVAEGITVYMTENRAYRGG